jgi:hypothetical protein
MLLKMRITIRLNDTLLSEARQVALKTNRTLTAFIEDALRQHLAHQMAVRETVQLRTVDGKGTLPGIDLDNSGSLFDLTEGDDAPNVLV